MSRKPFQPIGNRARWRIVFDVLAEREVDDVVRYEDLAGPLSVNPVDDLKKIQDAARRAGRELEEVHKRAIEAVPDIGYRIVRPAEHLRLARHHQKTSTRALVRARSKAVNVDFEALDDEQRHRLEVAGRAILWLIDRSIQLDIRQNRVERALAAMDAKHDRTDAEVRELRERLAKMESELETRGTQSA
jgi:hypothetical protein